MTKSQKIALFLLRIALGFLFLYAGISKIISPEWTSAGYLRGAQTLTDFYQWLAMPQSIAWVDFFNMWGLALIGVAMVIGLAVRSASFFGALLMVLYYIPIVKFPYAGAHAYIVDEHIIYIAGFVLLMAFHAGSYWGIDGVIERSKKIPAAWKKCIFCK